MWNGDTDSGTQIAQQSCNIATPVWSTENLWPFKLMRHAPHATQGSVKSADLHFGGFLETHRFRIEDCFDRWLEGMDDNFFL